jgi:predicted nucleotidyltransferase
MKQKTYDLDKEERKRLVQHLVENLKRHNEIIFAYLFGSFTEGLPFHDIDIGVYLLNMREEKSTFFSLDLSQTLSIGLQIPVDVRVLNFASVPFLYHVIHGTLILERDEDIRMDFVERITAKYLDLKPLLLKATKEAFGG